MTHPSPAHPPDLNSVGDRLRGYLTYYARLYPSAWRDAEQFRRLHAELGPWPEWVYVPMAGASATVTGVLEGAPVDVVKIIRGRDTGVVAALIPWRIGQGVYRYDPDLLDALWHTPVTGDLPSDLLFRLPEYGVYIEAPAEQTLNGRRLLGAFAHLEWDMKHGHAELRLVLDFGEPASLMPVPIHLGGTLEHGLRSMVRVASVVPGAPTMSRADVDRMARALASSVEPLVSCLLYLCSEAAEYRGGTVPSRPIGKRLSMPPSRATEWLVGERTGSALRQARSAAEGAGSMGGGGAPVRPHLRRAHWHTYLTGPKAGSQTCVLRWLPPILVGTSADDHPVVIHPVHGRAS